MTQRKSAKMPPRGPISAGNETYADTDAEAMGETPIAVKVRLAREAEAAAVDYPDPAGRTRGTPDTRIARLSPSVILVLIALVFGLAAILIVYGGVL